jgi:hypothetical protein
LFLKLALHTTPVQETSPRSKKEIPKKEKRPIQKEKRPILERKVALKTLETDPP